jgi:sugar phosphate isomerase/epimerase
MHRRDLLKHTVVGLAAMAAGGHRFLAAAERRKAGMRLGLCTYLWGQDWDLSTVIANCTNTQVLGVELRTMHKHGIEPSIGVARRLEVKKQFADSPITLVGLGTNECYHHTDRAQLRKAIENTKQFIKLSHDIGGGGVKVKPNDLPKGVPHERTIQQIGNALNQLGAFAADYGQQLRLEVHGQCSPLPIIRQIMDVVTHPNVGVCWNSNAEDLAGRGLAYNFDLVKHRLGATVHVRELNSRDYPYADLIARLVDIHYNGWILLECHTKPKDRVAAMRQQREVLQKLLVAAGKSPGLIPNP